jgi:rhodanese-related sulfurtransferase
MLVDRRRESNREGKMEISYSNCQPAPISVNLLLKNLLEDYEMRKELFILLAAVILLTTAVTGCNSRETKASSKANGLVAADTAAPNDGIKRINIPDARTEFDAGRAVIIDVRGEPTYKAGHIKGASMIAYADIASKAAELPKDKLIILYCSCPAEHTSLLAAQALKGKGVENTAALVGGYPKWQEAGYPTEKSQ